MTMVGLCSASWIAEHNGARSYHSCVRKTHHEDVPHRCRCGSYVDTAAKMIKEHTMTEPKSESADFVPVTEAEDPRSLREALRAHVVSSFYFSDGRLKNPTGRQANQLPVIPGDLYRQVRKTFPGSDILEIIGKAMSGKDADGR